MTEYEHYDGTGWVCRRRCTGWECRRRRSYKEQEIGYKKEQIAKLHAEIKILRAGGEV